MPKEKPLPTQSDAETPMIAGVTTMSYVDQPRTLPMSVDDAEREEGLSLYDRMYTNIAINSATKYLRDRIYENGLLITPAIEAPPIDAPPSSDASREFQESVRHAALVSSAIKTLAHKRNSLARTLREMHTWVRYGSALAEITFERMSDGEFSGQYGLGTVRYLPRRNYLRVIDPFGVLLGAIGIIPGKPQGLYQGLISDPQSLPNFVGVDRLMSLIVNPAEAGPGGESCYRSAYRPWRSFEMLDPVEVGNLYNFSGKSPWLVAPEKSGQPLKTEDGGGSSSVARAILKTVSEASNGVACVFPYGTSTLDHGHPDSVAFKEYAERRKQEMVMAVLYSARSLMESQRNSQADAGQAQDVADAAVSSAQTVIEEMLQMELFRPLLILNSGRSVAAKMTPTANLRKTSAGDIPKILSALSNGVRAGAITVPMLDDLFPRWLGVKYVPGETLEKKNIGAGGSVRDEDADDDSGSSRDD
jgi:hypothetical protein